MYAAGEIYALSQFLFISSEDFIPNVFLFPFFFKQKDLVFYKNKSMQKKKKMAPR